MGYVQSASTVTLRARLTQKGREELLSGTTMLTVKYFALGDGDANYRSTSILSAGRVPDVTGDYSGCTLSLADGVGLHHPIGVTGNTNPSTVKVPAPTATTTTLLFTCGNPSNITFSANTLNCNVHINRLMNAESKILYDWYYNSSFADGPAFNFSILGSPTTKSKVPGQPTTPIQFSGTNNGTVVVLSGEPYANFYDFICVNNKHESNGVITYTQEYDDVEMEFITPQDRFLWELINNIYIHKDSSAYPYDDNTSYTKDYTNYIRANGENTLEDKKPIDPTNPLGGHLQLFMEQKKQVSPMVTSFSSLATKKIPTSGTISSGTYDTTQLLGSGPGGLMVSAREFGYYCEFVQNKTLKGFLPVSLVEGNYESLFSNETNHKNIYPCVRIKPDLAVKENLRAGVTTQYPYNHVNGGTIETVFIYDAFSGYDNSTNPKYDFFYDGGGRRTFPTNEDVIYSMGRLKFDPFNPEYGNPLGQRGFANGTYTPSEYELNQMSAFDHIITQGRLLGLQTDPYIDFDTEGDGSNILPNEGFGCVGNGGVGPNGTFYSRAYEKTYTGGNPNGQIGGVISSKDFVFNTDGSHVSYLQDVGATTTDFWKASYQYNGAANYGLTLLSHERKMVDDFFRLIYGSIEGDEGAKRAFGKKVIQDGNEYSISISMIAKTKNLKDKNGKPYSGNLNLHFKNVLLKADTASGVVPTTSKGWGYVDNLSPIIERTTT